MFDLKRTHDYQVNLSPGPGFPAAVNPPCFTWPESTRLNHFTLELKNCTTDEEWTWPGVTSPFLLSFLLPPGQYQWRLQADSDGSASDHTDWVGFEVDEKLAGYVAPTAVELFAHCDNRNQWLMYFDEDVLSIRESSADIYGKLKRTVVGAVPVSQVRYPDHYRRGSEEGKRTAIADVRKWIDRDLVANALLYRVWEEQAHGEETVRRLLQLAEWSPEGPASLLRPCTWGDEVGLSLSRNLYLVYHWLSPLLTDSEKAFVRPMLVRIARQMQERLEQDEFKQYPGHSHTSRLPAYLGLAALALHKEHDRQECIAWLNYSLMIYRGVLPFYGGVDGSWAEGPFYASTYSKWFHPFFLSVERLSGFSFYEHPFYRNFTLFARDFILPQQAIHPFGDGFWCQRNGKEWPGFFSQNPLRIYAARFGSREDFNDSIKLENEIDEYYLHLLDAVPTIRQIEFIEDAKKRPDNPAGTVAQHSFNHYYSHAGLGKVKQGDLSLYYRASPFGNSSHRHADQGNFALFDKDVDILVPTGCYGYRFGSSHHSKWTRQTVAHNLPLLGQRGQILDDPRAVGKLIDRQCDKGYQCLTLDLSQSYGSGLLKFYRVLVLVEDYGLIIIDSISLATEQVLNWRLHSQLAAVHGMSRNCVLLGLPGSDDAMYQCKLLSHPDVDATLDFGYPDDLGTTAQEIEIDACKHVLHLNWQLASRCQHEVMACCIRGDAPLPAIEHATFGATNSPAVMLAVPGKKILIPRL